MTTSRPTAVAVAPDGTSYVGFATGGALARLDAAGERLAPMPVDVDGRIDGIAVDPTGNVWVDDGDSVAAHRADGTGLTRFPHVPEPTCLDDAAHDPASYGGLAVTASTVYVAGRCSGDLEVYSRAGALLARVDLPGSTRPSGVAWGRAQAGQPALLYVAQPDAARVLVYDADTLDSASLPLVTLAVAKADPGHAVPAPSGVAADRYGQLVVADRANHALYLYDANNSFVRYRVLGHPPEPSAEVGRLDGPTAIAQHDQDGGALSGELWIADSGNGRVQRWGTSGWTIWAADVLDPGAAAVPVNTALPVVTGLAVPGETLTCSPGGWRPTPTGYRYRWTRDGLLVPGQVAATRVLTVADEDTDAVCTVVAVNPVGDSEPASSEPVSVAGSLSVPSNVSRPTLSGTARPGQSLECGTGTWTGSPTVYAHGWLRDGLPLPDIAARRVLTVDDVDHAVSCRVRASNAHGSSGWSASLAVRVVAGGAEPPPTPPTPTPPGAPSSSACVGPASVVVAGGAAWTRRRDVVVRVRTPAGTTHLEIADNPAFRGAQRRALNGRCAHGWRLAGTSARTPQRVYVRFPGSGDPVTPTSDAIRYDGAAPVVTKAHARWSNRRGGWVLTARAKDTASGVLRFQSARADGTVRRTHRLRSRVVSWDRSVVERVRFYDRLGNRTGWVRVQFLD